MKHLFVIAVLVLLLGACGYPTEQGVVIRTADPALSILIPFAPAEVVPAEEVGAIGQEPPAVHPCIEIKVNRSADGTLIYHMPDGAYYDQVRIDESRGEFFACSEQIAIDAGARKASR